MSEQSFSIQLMGAEVRACFSEEFVEEMGRQLTPALLTYFGLKHVNKKISLIIFATFEYQDLWHAESMYPVSYTHLIKAVGKQLVCVHVNHGLLRKGEPEQVIEVFRNQMQANLVYVDAVSYTHLIY